ncbi:zinc ribbon domain-containing protein [Dehalobacterium formicoaceticum]|uniref:Zinc ribbon domain-containing protein n=1 Tax=Dehalobacterium formicoaceticum TaxID=51515 RepID=A0ABT1Y2Y3_9FIRM|nr:zinc ribbon domain-containing protein [Dehalobacterium formicoaceticum]MCR6545233.1 zinc ribbon domain-containing protein [Dehalobacterium formicoaceticum]
MELDNNNHSVFLMNYHLVLVIKYRRKVIDDRVWICSNCGTELDRDINAAINIRNEGRRLLGIA